jgi:hypothetical protein
MPTIYRTDVWQVRLPDLWQAAEEDGQAHVRIFRPGSAGILEVIATDDSPAAWRDKGADFSGPLFGKTGTLTFDCRFCRWWNLYCGSVTLYVSYRCAVENSELERVEVEEIVQSFSPAPNQGAAANRRFDGQSGRFG